MFKVENDRSKRLTCLIYEFLKRHTIISSKRFENVNIKIFANLEFDQNIMCKVSSRKPNMDFFGQNLYFFD